MNPRLRGLVLLVGASLSVSACSGGDAPDVGLAPVEVADVTEVVEAPATVAARASATLTAPADATVVDVAVTPGQQVAVGDLIVRLDSPAARDRLAAAREADAAVADGAVQLEPPALAAVQASSDAAAASSFAASREAAGLLPEGPARDAALERVASAEAQYELARQAALEAVRGVDAGMRQVGEALTSLTAAQRVQTRSAVALAEQAVAALEVRSPIAGVVQLGGEGGGGGAGAAAGLGSLPPDLQAQAGALLGGAASSASVAVPGLAVGAPVRAGAALATVVDVGELSLVADVDETDVLRVTPGAPATAELDSLPGVSYDASVTAVDLEPTTSAGGGVTYRVRLALGAGQGPGGEPAPRPRPGMSAVVDLVVASVVDAVAVPVTAVQRGVEGAAAEEVSVWVDEGGRAERRVVRLGPEGEDLVVVESGLRPGERVVVRGVDTVQPGDELPAGSEAT